MIHMYLYIVDVHIRENHDRMNETSLWLNKLSNFSCYTPISRPEIFQYISFEIKISRLWKKNFSGKARLCVSTYI